MSEETKTQDVDKLIQEGGKPLEDALREELNKAEGRQSAELDAKKTETENAEDQDLEDEVDDLEEPAEKDSEEESEEAEEEQEESDDKSKESKESGDADDSDGKTKKNTKASKNIKRLLEQRNSARDEAAFQKQRADEAEAKLAAKDQSEGEDADNEEESEDLDAKIKRNLDERDQERKREQTKLDLDRKEREALIAKYEPSAEELKAVDAVVEKHPTMSDESALRLVSPERFVNEGKGERKNSRKLESGAKPRRNLRHDPSINEMSTDDLEKHLKNEQKAGRLNI